MFCSLLRNVSASLVTAAFLLLSSFNVALAAQQPQGAPSLTKDDVDAWLDGMLSYAVATGDIAGTAIVVVKDGAVLTTRSYGYADLATKRPVDVATTLFRAASVSKPFAWTAVMQQVERGKLDLDKDVQEYLDFPLPVRDDGPITLRHLLTHRAGFDEFGHYVYADDPAKMLTLDQIIRHPPPRIRKAGTVSSYSNYGASLAGYIVQRVTNTPFDEYVEKEIFQPLHMAHSTFRQPLPAAMQPLMATGYASVTNPRSFEYVATSPAGGLTTSVLDMGNFAIAHLQQGRFGDTQILQPATADAMHAGQVEPVPGLPPMALGFYHRVRNDQLALVHAGDIQGFHSELFLLPGQNVGYYIAMNGSPLGSSLLRVKLWTGFVDRYFPKPVVQRPTLATAAEHGAMLAGRYEMSRTAEKSFLALGGMLGQFKLRVEQDGTLVTDSPRDLNRQPKRWHEVAPFVWQEENGPNRLIAVVENGKVLRFSTDDSIPVFEFWKVSWSRSAGWILPALAIANLILIVTVGRAVVRQVRAWRGKADPAPRIAGRRTLITAASLLLLFELGWFGILQAMGATLASTDGRLDPWIRVFELVALLAAGFFAVSLVLMLRDPGLRALPTRAGRALLARRGLVLLAGLLTLWVGWAFNLLPLSLVY